MIEAVSCGGVVIFRGKILLLYKNYRNRYEGWVLPKGTVEEGEEYSETALREVKEETGATAHIIKYVGKTNYSFNTSYDVVDKDVHWYLMMSDSYYSIRNRNVLQLGHIHSTRDKWRCQIGYITTVKRAISNTRDTTTNLHVRQTITTIKHPISDTCHTIRNRHAC